MTDKLRECPFCGGENVEVFAWEVTYQGNFFKPYCKDCDFELKPQMTEEEAIKAWNTRKPIDRIVEQLEALAEEADNTRNTYLAKHDWLPVNLYKGRYNAFDEAIEIVKGGE